MELTKYLPLIILAFVSIKLLLKFINENIVALYEQLNTIQIEKGILSIKDLQKDNYSRFIRVINFYLNTHGYKNLHELIDSDSISTNYIGILNNEPIYISCIQNEMIESDPIDEDNWTLTDTSTIKKVIGRMITNKCCKGIIIINSTFTDDSINFIEKFNNINKNIEIKLVDGYSLTKSIRNYKDYIINGDEKFELQ